MPGTLDNPGSVGWEGAVFSSHLTCDGVSFLSEHSDMATLVTGRHAKSQA